MRLLLIAADAQSAGSLAPALAARGVEVLDLQGERGTPLSPPADLLLVESSVDATRVDRLLARDCSLLPIVLAVRTGRDVSVEWVRRAPVDVVPLDAAGCPTDSPPALEARLLAALESARRRDRQACALASFEGSAAPTCLLDSTGRVECANAAFARLLERSPAEPLPSRLAEVVHAPEEGTSEVGFVRAMATHRAFEGEVRLLGSRGRPVVCWAALAPIAGREGSVVVLTDVTRRAADEAALRDANRRLAEVASTDPLTGLHNRTYLQQALDREVARWRRYGQPFAVLMLDLDDFKRVNDVHGHEVGDDVLRAVAGALREGLRDGDVLARYGGDEFCAILPSADLATATRVAERVIARVSAVAVGSDPAISLAASVGVALTTDLHAEDGALDLIRLADRAMLGAKREGGNRCRHGRPAPPAGPPASGPTRRPPRSAS